MIWQSVVLMTLVDLIIVGCGVYAAVSLVRYRAPVEALGVMRSAVMIVAGVLLIALLYAADLFAMLVLPWLTDPGRAMQVMEVLHLELSWGIFLAGVVLLVAGIAILMRKLLPEMAARIESVEGLNATLESSRRELEDRFYAVTDAVPVGVVIAEVEKGDVLFANRMWSSMFRAENAGIGTSAADCYAPSSQRKAMLEALDADGRFGPEEVVFRDADGREFPAVMSSTEIRFNGQRAVLSALLETSELHATQQRLQSSERRFRAVAQATPYPLYLSRRSDGQLLYANEALCSRIGIRDDPLSHRSIELYWDPADRVNLLASVEREGRYPGAELRLKSADGRMFWAIVSGVAIEFEGEDCLLTSFIDITEEKLVEDELAAHRDRLEELVQARTGELVAANRALLKKERLAVIGQLTATVAHELRNPLGTIITSLELLRPEINTGERRYRRALERVDRNVARCTTIIDDLLNYARSRPLALKPAPLDDWLKQLVAELDSDDGVELTTSYASTSQARFDPDRMRQAVVNLVQNARQSMTESDVATRQLTVASRRRGDRVEIEVSDTGPGIQEEHLDHIFEPLFSTRAFGIGLGLPLVREIMSEHGGGVEVTSEVGAGTRVVLWWPLQAVSDVGSEDERDSIPSRSLP